MAKSADIVIRCRGEKEIQFQFFDRQNMNLSVKKLCSFALFIKMLTLHLSIRFQFFDRQDIYLSVKKCMFFYVIYKKCYDICHLYCSTS